MQTEPELLLDVGAASAEHLFFVLLTVAIGLIAGMAAGIALMSDLLPAIG